MYCYVKQRVEGYMSESHSLGYLAPLPLYAGQEIRHGFREHEVTPMNDSPRQVIHVRTRENVGAFVKNPVLIQEKGGNNHGVLLRLQDRFGHAQQLLVQSGYSSTASQTYAQATCPYPAPGSGWSECSLLRCFAACWSGTLQGDRVPHLWCTVWFGNARAVAALWFSKQPYPPDLAAWALQWSSD